MTELTPEERRLLNAGMTVVKSVSGEFSVYGRSPEKVNATNVPDDVEPQIYEHLKRLPAHEVYGSVPAKSQSPTARAPSDIDMVVPDPRSTAYDIKHQLEARGYKTKINSMPRFGSYVVQVKNKEGDFVDAADIHPLEGHYGKYDVHGESLPPYKMEGVYVQPIADQLMRKANSVLGHNKKDGGWGAADHRELKDTVDFVTTARTLIDSKRLQAEAELEQVEDAEDALIVWEDRVRKLEGYDHKQHGVGKDPIPEKYEQKFIRFAKEHPDTDPEDIIMGPRGGLRVIDREKPTRTGERANPMLSAKRGNAMAKYPYSADPYAADPYVEDPYAADPYEEERGAVNPYPDPYPEQRKRKRQQKRQPRPARQTNPGNPGGEFGNIGTALLNENGRTHFMGLGEKNPFANVQESFAEPRSGSGGFAGPAPSGPTAAVTGLGNKLGNSFGNFGRGKHKSSFINDGNLF